MESSATRIIGRPIRERFSERLIRQIDIRGDDECWPWTGTKIQGYGVIRYASCGGGHQVRATHAVYEHLVGKIPAGMFILHSCDNPPCCNPKHLRPGTIQDNKRDEVARGRHVRGITSGVHGELHHDAKLTRTQVTEIRALRGKMFQKDIAARYGITQTTVSCILRGKTWAWHRDE